MNGTPIAGSAGTQADGTPKFCHTITPAAPPAPAAVPCTKINRGGDHDLDLEEGAALGGGRRAAFLSTSGSFTLSGGSSVTSMPEFSSICGHSDVLGSETERTNLLYEIEGKLKTAVHKTFHKQGDVIRKQGDVIQVKASFLPSLPSQKATTHDCNPSTDSSFPLSNLWSKVTLTDQQLEGQGKEEVEFSHLGQSNEIDMDNNLYDFGAAMSHEHSMLRDIDSDLGDGTSSGTRGGNINRFELDLGEDSDLGGPEKQILGSSNANGMGRGSTVSCQDETVDSESGNIKSYGLNVGIVFGTTKKTYLNYMAVIKVTRCTTTASCAFDEQSDHLCDFC